MRTKRAKSWLIKSTLIAPLAWTPAMLHAQDAVADAATSTEEPEPETVIVTGTRASGISATHRTPSTRRNPIQQGLMFLVLVRGAAVLLLNMRAAREVPGGPTR